MDIDIIREAIENTDYWDMEVLELNISFFGDEVTMIVDKDDENAWKISFTACYKVSYETDALMRKISYVKDMKRPQRGYYAQDITVNEGETEGVYKVIIDLSIMEIIIQCKSISVEKIPNAY